MIYRSCQYIILSNFIKLIVQFLINPYFQSETLVAQYNQKTPLFPYFLYICTIFKIENKGIRL